MPPALPSSFEVQLLELNFAPSILCAVVYRPPKCNFVCEFADLLGNLFYYIIYYTIYYDYIFITSDFNIHVCCESDLLVKDFLALVDPFYLTQSE